MRAQWLLQRALGGVRRIPGAAARFVDGGSSGSDRCRLGITPDCLRALLSGQAPIIVCRGAVPTSVCERAATRLEQAGDVGGALDDAARDVSTGFAEWRLGGDPDAPPSDYAKLGYTKTDVFLAEGVRMSATKKASMRYLDRAAETARFLSDDVFTPQRCPIDDICDEVQSLPGFDCRLERCPVTDRPFLPCVVRRMGPGGRKTNGNIHMDTVAPGTTLSANIYLRVPEDRDGGELVLYPTRKRFVDRVLNSHFFDTLEAQNFYPEHTFYTETLLNSGVIEPIVYRPRVGDVVLIDPAYPHGVRDFTGDPGHSSCRISLQTFLQCSWHGRSSRWPWGSSTRLLEYAI